MSKCYLNAEVSIQVLLFRHPTLEHYNFCCCLSGQGLEEVSRTDIGKKIKEGMEEAAKTAKTSAENVSKGGERLGKTGAFKAISQVKSFCFLVSFLLNN